jgi:hypothetical protein
MAVKVPHVIPKLIINLLINFFISKSYLFVVLLFLDPNIKNIEVAHPWVRANKKVLIMAKLSLKKESP